MKKLRYTLLLVAGLNIAIAQAEPVGALNPKVTQSNIGRTVCVPGYSKTIRPSSRYTNTLKHKQMGELSLPGFMNNYEEDHWYPLSLGGHPTDERNLWPQPWSGKHNAKDKDKVEQKLHRALCNRLITLTKAQECISKWQQCVVPVKKKVRK